MFRKSLTIVTLSVVSLIALTGCSTSGGSTETEDKGIPFSGTNLVKVDFDMDAVPAVTVMEDNSFLFIHGGSSSCPNEIETISEGEKENQLVIEFKEVPADKACTADFTLQGVEIVLGDTDFVVDDDTTFMLSNATDLIPVEKVDADSLS